MKRRIDPALPPRTIPVAGLLTAVFLLSALLAWQAASARIRHREAAARIVSDYGEIAGEHFLRGIAFELEAGAFTPTRLHLAQRLAGGKPLPAIDSLKDAAHPGVGRVASMMESLFLVNFRTGTVVPEIDPTLRSWVVSSLESRAAEVRAQRWTQVTRLPKELGGHTLVYGVAPEGNAAFGFKVTDEGLQSLFADSYRTNFHLPGLLHPRIRKEDLFIRIRRGETVLFETAGSTGAGTWRSVPIARMYGDVFSNGVIETSIAPEAAPHLVSGGVPPSRTALVLLLLGAATLALAATGIALRRERQLELLRSDLVTGVSHELRTPLTQIRMFSETLLLGRVRSEEDRNRALRIIHQETARLTYLVDNLLFFSKEGRRDAPFPLEAHDIVALVSETIETFEPIATSRRVTIELDAPDPVIASVDRDSFKQVVINLLDNALKYGPLGQTVRVGVTEGKETFRIEVADQGPGVPPGERELVWTRFYRSTLHRGSHESGSGIGLAVVAQIVGRLGGRCSIEDAVPGGARFVIESPIGAESRPREDAGA